MMPKNITINSDKCLLLVAGCVFTSGSILFSQVAASAKSGSQAETGAAQMPAFEVATIRPSNPNRPGAIGLYTYPRGKIYAGESTLRMLVQYAFNVQSFQVSGGPRWMDEDKYEVVALPPATSKSAEARPAVINEPPNDEQRQMLQSLLIDRFGLKFHREIKEGPVYVLVRSNKKLQMEDAKNKKEIPWVAVVIERNGVEGGMAGNNATMSLMATRLSRYLERPVLDRTGLKGSFDFELAAPEESSYDVINGIFDSVIRLGLKLKADKGPVETVVIDRAMKPMEN